MLWHPLPSSFASVFAIPVTEGAPFPVPGVSEMTGANTTAGVGIDAGGVVGLLSLGEVVDSNTADIVISDSGILKTYKPPIFLGSSAAFALTNCSETPSLPSEPSDSS